MRVTAKIASGFCGDKLYQRRAREALPILVRQAKAGNVIVYEDLAAEMAMPNPRNLNYPLGCIGDALNELARSWDSEIPHIQALVVNKNTCMPGPGFDEFLKQRGKNWSSPRDRRAIIETYWAEITAFPYWDAVLAELGVKPAEPQIASIIAKASRSGGGEGPEHLAMKELVSRHPELVGLVADRIVSVLEHYLPSGDSVDVFFETEELCHAVEVKPSGAPDFDVARGLFQCVKYQAVLQANAAFKNDNRSVSTVLALGGKLPEDLISLRNSLGVKVYEGLKPI